MKPFDFQTMVSNSFNVEHVAANVANVSDICFVGGPWGPLANHAATCYGDCFQSNSNVGSLLRFLLHAMLVHVMILSLIHI